MKISKSVFSKAFEWARKVNIHDYEKRWVVIAAFNAGWKAAKKKSKK